MEIINKTMDRADLFEPEALRLVERINSLILELRARGLYPSSWYGTFPSGPMARMLMRALACFRGVRIVPDLERQVGRDNRGPDYAPLPNAADDDRIPWYLYWEIIWSLTRGPHLDPGMRLLDAGGCSSLFSCYLASLGYEVHSIDLNRRLVANADCIARAMGWNMKSYVMNMASLRFPDSYFDHAYSICVFEHLPYGLKHAALREIDRCLKPNGVLSITFDYRNPAPHLAGIGPDTSAENRISTVDDLDRAFLSTGEFRLLGNQKFYDNGLNWLCHPSAKFNNQPYTFGAIFLERSGEGRVKGML